MDRAKFTAESPGRVVPIAHPRKDWAFIPDEMPPKWQFALDLWPVVVEAREALGTLNGIGQTLPNPALLLRPLQKAEAIASSSIEGTYVTPQQLLLYEMDPREPHLNDERMADRQEVFNYSNALRRGCELLHTLPICGRLIKELHYVLMQGVRGRTKAPGQCRTWQVQIGSSGRFIPPPPDHLERLMTNLEQYINGEDERYDPLTRAFLVHYQFEAIHPFGDGNGRVGRLLLALMIYQRLRHSHPWLYMSAYFEEFKEEYMSNLFKVSVGAGWHDWIEFCLRGTIMQANDSISRCRAFNRLYDDFHKRIDSPTSRTHQIIDYLFESSIVSVTAVAKQCSVSYNTASKDIKHFIQAGILEEMKEGYPKLYYSPEIMEIAYRPTGETKSQPDAATLPVAADQAVPSTELKNEQP